MLPYREFLQKILWKILILQEKSRCHNDINTNVRNLLSKIPNSKNMFKGDSSRKSKCTGNSNKNNNNSQFF